MKKKQRREDEYPIAMSIGERPRGMTKVEALCTQLHDLALHLGPGEKLPTTRELAVRFAVNQVTLSDALGQLEARDVIYRRQGSGIYVSPTIYRKTICVFLDSFFFLTPGLSPFWGMLWAQIAREAQERGPHKNEYYSFHFVLTSHDRDITLPEDVQALVRDKRLHGVLSIGLQEANTDWLRANQVPCVAFAGYSPWTVTNDNIELIRLGVHHLTEQGCQRIGLWTPVDYHHSLTPQPPIQPPPLPDRFNVGWDILAHYDPEHGIIPLTPEDYSYRFSLNRDYAFCHFLAERGVSFYPDLSHNTFFSSHRTGMQRPLTHQEQGYLAVMEVFGRDKAPKPDGIICTDDLFMDGALGAFHKLGVRIGEDVKIATHANVGSTILFGRADDLTLIAFDPVDLAHAMFMQLDGLLSGELVERYMILVRPQIRHTQGAFHFNEEDVTKAANDEVI